MKKSLILKLFIVGAMVLSASPSSAFWLTLDTSAVGKAIQNGLSMLESIGQGEEETASTQKMLAGIGDRVGGLNKFRNEEEEAEQRRLKEERRAARASELQKAKEKWQREQQVEAMRQQIINPQTAGQETYNETPSVNTPTQDDSLTENKPAASPDFSEGSWDGSAPQEETPETQNELTPAEKQQTREDNISDVAPVKKPGIPESEQVRQPFKTSEASRVENILIKLSPMSFAQIGGGFKTGTSEDGIFVFSDIIANKCSMGVEDVKPETVRECVKTWVLAMNDESGTEALKNREEFVKALHDHVEANITKALENMVYTAQFDEDVAQDLEKKSEKLTTVRDEISMVGKIMSVEAGENNGIFLRMLQNNSADLIYDSLREMQGLSKDYYEEDEGK